LKREEKRRTQKTNVIQLQWPTSMGYEAKWAAYC
jgi:hypothetical protein